MAIQQSFLGTGWAFPPTFDKCSRGVSMVSDLDDICQSLTILFETSLGERVMQPKYGAGLQDYVFEAMNTGLLAYIQDMIKTAIIYHEPRINLLGVNISTEFALEGRLDINISFSVRTTNSRYNFVYPFYLKEGTGIV